MGLSKMLYDQTGSEKSNMAAFKPEVQLPNRTEGSVLRRFTRKCNSKMAPLKLEILISQLEDKVGKYFQRGQCNSTLVYKLRYGYIRFVGRHFRFSTSG